MLATCIKQNYGIRLEAIKDYFRQCCSIVPYSNMHQVLITEAIQIIRRNLQLKTAVKLLKICLKTLMARLAEQAIDGTEDGKPDGANSETFDTDNKWH